jgi:hypothetical protein
MVLLCCTVPRRQGGNVNGEGEESEGKILIPLDFVYCVCIVEEDDKMLFCYYNAFITTLSALR